MYQTVIAREAFGIARALRIDYIWIDATERAAHSAGMAKFDTGSEFFTPVFRNSEVLVLRVR
jgi:uncharacterized membrane protein